MEKIITEVGLVLNRDEKQNATSNLFHQLFGRWPQSTKELEDRPLNELKRIISSTTTDGGNIVYQFFGIKPSVALDCCNCTPEILYSIKEALQKLRSNYAVDILCIYGEDFGSSAYDLIKENRKLTQRVSELEQENQKITSQREARKIVLSRNIQEIPLSEETRKILNNDNIQTVYDLTQRTAHEIRRLTGMTDEDFVDIVNCLSVLELHFLPPAETHIN